jgi:hypothetical protein
MWAAAVCAAALALSGTALAAAPAEYKSSEDEFQALKRVAKPRVPVDWTGVWRRALGGPGPGIFCFDQDSGPNPKLPNYCGSSAPLNQKYREAYEKKVDQIAQGIEWDRLSWCLPVGMPRWLTEPWLREFIVTPDETWLIHEQMQEIRRVYTDGRGHLADKVAIPLWEGDSIGFWDGDTLVIHTNHLKAGQYQRGQPDYSFNVTTVERMRKLDPQTIETQVTVYDPSSLTKPYHASFRYRKQAPEVRVQYNSCEEGNNATRTPEGGTTFILPGEPGYRNPTTLGIPEVALDTLPQ